MCAVLPRPGDRSSRVAPRSPGSGAAASRPPPRRYPPGGADIQVTTVVNSVLTRTDLQNIAQLLDNSNSGSAARPAPLALPAVRAARLDRLKPPDDTSQKLPTVSHGVAAAGGTVY